VIAIGLNGSFKVRERRYDSKTRAPGAGRIARFARAFFEDVTIWEKVP